jgi:hypothetical protein
MKVIYSSEAIFQFVYSVYLVTECTKRVKNSVKTPSGKERRKCRFIYSRKQREKYRDNIGAESHRRESGRLSQLSLNDALGYLRPEFPHSFRNEFANSHINLWIRRVTSKIFLLYNPINLIKKGAHRDGKTSISLFISSCVYNGRECGERGASPRRQHIKDAPFGAISTTNSPSFIPFVRKNTN